MKFFAPMAVGLGLSMLVGTTAATVIIAVYAMWVMFTSPKVRRRIFGR